MLDLKHRYQSLRSFFGFFYRFAIFYYYRLRKCTTLADKESQRIFIFNWLNHLIKSGFSQKRPEESDLARVARLLPQVEYYQPLEGYPFTLGKPERPCIDRADCVYQALMPYGKGLKIIDCGSSLGYFPFYFGKRGYSVMGYDASSNNTAVAQALLPLNQDAIERVEFQMGMLNEDFALALNYREYEVCFLFSILHHICLYQGLEATQNILATLTKKVPILFIEFATSAEIGFPWSSALPHKIEDYFTKCTDLHIQLLGYFPNHLNLLLRPLYKITQNVLKIENQTFPIDQQFYSPHSATASTGRAYYTSGKYFIKEYPPILPTAFSQEADILTRLNGLPNIPKLQSTHKTENGDYLIMENVEGSLLLDLILKNQPIDKARVIHDLLKIVHSILQKGIYHNDLRLWNIMLSEKNTILIDFSYAGSKERESHTTALLTIIHQLYSPYPFIDPKYPCKRNLQLLEDLDLPSDIISIVKKLSTSHSLRNFFKRFP